MSNLHPILQQALRVFTDTTTKNLETVAEQYIEALTRHDWAFEYSEDASVYARGRKERADLLAMRPICDPDWVLWNKHAPSDYRKERIKEAP